MFKRIIIGFLLFLTVQVFYAQTSPHDLRKFEFIHYDLNRINFYGDSTVFNPIFNKFDHLNLLGEGKIHILHIGDSHIQADYFTGEIREKLHAGFSGSEGSRGIVFPYKIPDRNTNDPFNYTWKWTGTWIGYKNLKQTISCDLGITGNYAYTATNGATLTFIQRSYTPYPIYDYNIIKIFHKVDSCSFSVSFLNDVEIVETLVNKELGFTQYKLSKSLSDTLKLRFDKTDSVQRYFELYGISLESTDPGIIYSSCGVNGSDIDDWLKCNLLPKELKAINPDMIVISLGTNDVFMKYFNPDIFEANYKVLIKRIQAACPHTPIILTTPADHYRSGMYLNKNTAKSHGIIHDIAEDYGLGVWDLYTIMGGENSIVLWYNEGLTAKDRLHYSKAGYEFQGDLFYSAIMKSYETYIEQKYRPISISNFIIPQKKESFDAIYAKNEKGKKKKSK